MTNIPTISPFDGKPFTRAFNSKKEGEGFHIVIRELTPFRAKLVDFLSGIFFLLIGGTAIAVLIEFNQQADFQDQFIYCFVSFLIWLITRYFLVFVFKKITIIKITAKYFSVRGIFGYRNYNRELQHKFSMLRHDKTQKEKQTQSLTVQKAQKRGKIISPKIYYGESYHLVFEHIGHRRDIASVYGRNETLAALARLKACDEVITSKTQNGSDGVATNPQDQWGDQAGEIPEDT